MTDKLQAGLRGPVKTCAIECDYVYPDQHSRCDDRGRISEREHLTDRTAKQLFSYRYDAFGRLERIAERSGTGPERVSESIHYDLAGRKTATAYPNLNAHGECIGIDIEATFEASADASSIVTIFDDRDRPVKRVFYDPNGLVERRILLRYDPVGRLLEEGELETDGSIREDLRSIYRYDTEGRLIEKVMHRSAFGTHRKTFTYNEYGDILEESYYRTGGILDEGRDQEWTNRYGYTYDDRANWIERVTEIVLPGAEASVGTVDRRRLDYY